MPKTVFVLGAGFSKPAGFPLQAEIYPRLVSKLFQDDAAPYFPINSLVALTEFLSGAGFVDRRKRRPFFRMSLEDLFTLLDRVIQDRGVFNGFPWSRIPVDDNALLDDGVPRDPLSLIEIRESLIRCILGLLHGCSATHAKKADTFAHRFATHLIARRIKAGLRGDPFSVISLNWDSLLEDCIFAVLKRTGAILDGKSRVDVDYCVYTNPLDGSPHTPSTKQRASGIYNIKVLKVHGSSTWLRCPNSNLVYTGLGSDKPASGLYIEPRASPFIGKYGTVREKRAGAFLEPFIITPSFTKVLDLPQIQATWHNAYVELREADSVVIIGYSLPEADHQFRTLLRRSVRPSAKVHVVLKDATSARKAMRRYRELFSKRQLSYEASGVEGYVGSQTDRDKSQKLRAWIARRFGRSQK